MTAAHSAQLRDRGVVAVTGPDAEKLLQGLITNDVTLATGDTAIHAGLLSPQGKIQFDFFVVRSGEGFLLEAARDKAPDIAKRLTLYRLRSKAIITDESDNYKVYAAWGAAQRSSSDSITFTDPRLPLLGQRTLLPAGATTPGEEAGEAAYHAHRIALGVPEGGRDYAFGDTFPHEALFDQLNGVSFTKGCYVGQEIVSRMQHRASARKRIVQVHSKAALPATATDVMAGDVAIGALGSVDGSQGLALVRLDRAAEFHAKGVPFTVAGVAIQLRRPSFATFALDLAPPAAADTPL